MTAVLGNSPNTGDDSPGVRIDHMKEYELAGGYDEDALLRENV